MTVDAALASSESGRQVPVPLGGRSTASGVRPSVRVFPKNRCERAASGILSHTKKFFCKSVFHTKATFMGQNHFWTGKFRMDDRERLIRSADGPAGAYRRQSQPVPCLSSADGLLARCR